jgi:hypothetical protein
MIKAKYFNPYLDIRRFFVHFVSYAVPAFWASSLFIAFTDISHSQALIRLQTTEQKTIYLDEGSIREGGGYITYETVHKFNKPAEILDDKNVRVLFDLAINEVAGDCNYQIRGLKSILFFPVDKGAAPFRFYTDFVMTKDNPGSYGLLELNRACAFGK